MSDESVRSNAQMSSGLLITPELIRHSALKRYFALGPVVWVPPPDVEPEVAVRVALAYGGLPAYAGEVPVEVAAIIRRLFPDWPCQRRIDLLRGVVGCGTLTAYYATRNEQRPCRRRRKGGQG